MDFHPCIKTIQSAMLLESVYKLKSISGSGKWDMVIIIFSREIIDPLISTEMFYPPRAYRKVNPFERKGKECIVSKRRGGPVPFIFVLLMLYFNSET